MLTWLSVWVKVQICIWPSWCHCHSLSLSPVNPDWIYLPGFTFLVPVHRLVPVKIQEGCVCVCVWCVYVLVIITCQGPLLFASSLLTLSHDMNSLLRNTSLQHNNTLITYSKLCFSVTTGCTAVILMAKYLVSRFSWNVIKESSIWVRKWHKYLSNQHLVNK